MHARLIGILALAALISSSACGRSERDPVDVESPAAGVAADAPPPSEEELEPAAERHDSLPPSFPHDIEIPAGLTAKSVQSEHAGTYVAIFTGDLDPEAVYRFFSVHLLAEGWSIDKAQGTGAELGIFASKGDRITTVISTRIDGILHVELGVYGGS